MLIAICIVLVIAVALLAIPRDVWGLILENCVDQRGRMRARYAWKEAKSVGSFYSGFLLGAILITPLMVGAVIAIDLYLASDYVSIKTPQQRDAWNRLLWKSVPIVILVGFAVLVVLARLLSRGYKMSMDQLVLEATSRNREKIARHYLQSTAQNHNHWNRSSGDVQED